jgi:hypothetical protein
LTVCIAAKAAIYKDPALILCMDMMGSTEASSAETTWKLHALCPDFHGLIAGPISAARELAAYCGIELDAEMKRDKGVPDLLQALRNGVGVYKRALAGAYIRSRIGLSYDEFIKDGKAFLSEDVHREMRWEIKNQYSCAELIVAGFCPWPVILKVSGDIVINCDDFAVVGTGTTVAESSLLHRSQNMQNSIDLTIYQVYEAKRLAEKAPGVGKTTKLAVFRPARWVQFVLKAGFDELEEQFEKFGPHRITLRDLPEGILTVKFQQDEQRSA